MPRLPEFDRTEVVQSALEVFWKDGYESSTIEKLLGAMGLNRGSLYAAFGGKERLFREVMDHYVGFMFHILESTLLGRPDPVDAIRSFLERVSVLEPADTRTRGCLLFNTISELAHTKPHLAAEASAKVGLLRDLFIQRLGEAHEQQLIRDDATLEELADYLIALAAGLRMRCKMHTASHTLQKIVDMGLETILRQPAPGGSTTLNG